MKLYEQTIHRNYIYKGKIVNLRCDDARLPDGRDCKREVIEHSGGACVLCVREGKVALVRQFRYAYGEEILELPAGKINADEDPKLCAARELSEETGLIAERLSLMHVIYPTPGYTNERIYVYFAEGLSEGRAHLDEGEFLNVVYLPVEDVLEKIKSGEIKDAKTIIGLYCYLLSK